MNVRTLLVCAAAALAVACTTVPVAEPPPPLPPAPPSEPAPVVVPAPEPSAEQPPPPVRVVVEAAASARALDYFARIRQRPARELRLEYDSLRRAFGASKSDHDRIRLALLLSLPAAPFADEAQALELLEPLTRDVSNEYQALAQLLSTFLNEQKRRSSQAMALQQKLDRIKALEHELQQRAATPESRPR
jgi:hypothetical protein